MILIAAWLFTLSSPSKPAPAPLPFSCSSLLQSLAPVDGGGQVAPLCGATPYPQTIPPDGGNS